MRKGGTGAHQIAGSVLPTSNERVQGSRDTSPGGDSRYLIARPLQQGKWSKGKDGFLVTDTWSSDMNALHSSFPTILLQQTKERMYLSAHQHKNVTIILLIPVTSTNNPERELPLVKQQFLENVSSLSLLRY